MREGGRKGGREGGREGEGRGGLYVSFISFWSSLSSAFLRATPMERR